MSPIRIEIAGRSFTAQNKEVGGIKLRGSNLGIAYSGFEDGGRIVIAHKTNELSKTDNKEKKYQYKEPIIIRHGEEPIEKEIEYETANGQTKTIKTRISAL
jgi:hypothetical protein